ncbi:ABC transporter ATP-binding protein [Streptococcus agalactiae]|uniref:ABC transporter ATP-binding protein n=1 Tax=Streptococcus agalactiae TaxID=1311 RepID=UPI0006589935|nr:ABC transporter ATP-binding protein [Streptococcus agalactiae]KLL71302.1 ABC transporter [Streptococcus agalactiae]
MKTKSQKTSFFSNLSPYLKGYKLLFALAIVLATLSSLTTVIGPDRLKEMTDLMVKGLAGNIDLAKIGHIAGQLAVLYVLGALVSYLASFIVTTIIQKFAQGMRNAIADKINKIPLSYFDSHTQGDTLSRVTKIMMFKTDWHLATTAIISVFSGFALSSIIMVKSQPLFKKQQMNLANISGYVEEIYSGHNIVTSHNARQQAKSDFQLLNDKIHSSMWKSQFFSGIMMPLMQFIGNFGYVMVCVVGAMLAIKGTITMGTIVAFMTYVRIFTQPIGQIAQGITQLQSASAAMGRVFEFLNETNMQEDKHKVLNLPKFKGYVSFEHVKFGYSDNKTIIHDFTSEAQPGQKVAIVGPTGAGKTTIVNLLMRFYDVNSGSISIDDINIQDMKRSQVHDAFSMVLQDIWLFEGTIKENLIFNQTTISDDEVQEAAKAVGVHHFIMTLPKGYDTVLDDAVTLSVGQKQLLTIARALLKNSPLLILDEATSSVDTRTEELIQKAMDKLMEGRTSFVIAHRLSTIKNADLILVMKDGNIIEQGSHDVLMSQSGFYADLYNSQFESA